MDQTDRMVIRLSLSVVDMVFSKPNGKTWDFLTYESLSKFSIRDRTLFAVLWVT